MAEVENKVEQAANSMDALDEIEQIMLEELRFYSKPENSQYIKSQRLNITDRMCKSANVVLSTENLKERRFMNRTERRDLQRKMDKTK